MSLTNCPQCGSALPLEDGWVVWCSGCDWNVAATPDQTRPAASIGQLLERVAAASGDRLAANLGRSDALEPHLTPGLAAAYALATAIHVAAIGLVAGAVLVAVVWFPNPFALVGAAAMLAFGWLIRPRLGKAPRTGVLPASEAPLLHGLVSNIARALETRAADILVVDDTFNASWSARGLGRRRVLTIGLPLLAVLQPQERVALIAHELAHAKHGDLQRSFLISSALRTLEELYLTLTPGASALTYSEVGGLDLIARAMLWVVAQPVRGIYNVELHLLLRDMQRAEYLADARAASVAGTAGMVGLHDALLAQPVVAHAVGRAAHDRLAPERLLPSLADAIREMPLREQERRRRAAALERTRLGATHPPTAMRIDLLQSRPPALPRVELEREESIHLDEELEARYAEAGQQLIDGFRSSLYR